MNKKTVQSILVLFIASFYLYGCSSLVVKQNDRSISVYDRVMQSGKIRCAYGIYEPGCMKDPNTGKLSGIGVEAFEIIAKKLGLKVEWTEEIAWGTMIEGLQRERYDIVVTPVWTNASRARLADFSKPLYFSFLYAYIKPGNKQFKNHSLDQINSDQFKIATLDGATAQLIANEEFPQAKQVSFPQYDDLSQLLMTVASGKADVTFAEPVQVGRFLKHNPGTLQELDKNQPVRVFSNCWIFKRGQLEFKSMVDTVLDELINDGTLEKLIRKYEPAPNSLYRVALPYRKS